ncbi:hypothetical protein GGGNBK_03495 [Sporosarcina sp. ANT_H38]
MKKGAAVDMRPPFIKKIRKCKLLNMERCLAPDAFLSYTLKNDSFLSPSKIVPTKNEPNSA